MVALDIGCANATLNDLFLKKQDILQNKLDHYGLQLTKFQCLSAKLTGVTSLPNRSASSSRHRTQCCAAEIRDAEKIQQTARKQGQ